MDALNTVHLSYKPHSLCVVIRLWEYGGEKALMIRATGSFFLLLLGNGTPNSIRDCQNADEFVVPSHLMLFTVTCGVTPLHEEEKCIPSLIGCLSL